MMMMNKSNIVNKIFYFPDHLYWIIQIQSFFGVFYFAEIHTRFIWKMCKMEKMKKIWILPLKWNEMNNDEQNGMKTTIES